MIPCPKCSRENDDKALYCDQCRTAVSSDVPGEVLEEPCPACGGEVREVPSVMAICGDCGISCGETSPEGGTGSHEDAPVVGRPSASPQPQAQPPVADEGEKVPCPVCGAENGAGAVQCGGCKIAFGRLRRPVACPKCSEESTDDVCDCGAILTLPKLVGFLDGSVKVVCSVCKQLFTVNRGVCSDCGGETRPVDSLKAFAASRPR